MLLTNISLTFTYNIVHNLTIRDSKDILYFLNYVNVLQNLRSV